MLALTLIVAFVFCLGMTAAGILVSYQLVTTYNTTLHKQLLYYLIAFWGFAFYGIWGQILARSLLASISTEAAVVETVAGFVPVLGVPFLIVSWIMLINMAYSMAGKAAQRTWLAFHAAVFVLLLVGAWLSVRQLGVPTGSLDASLTLLEAAGMTAVELLYFATFLVIVLRLRARNGENARKALLGFSLLLCGAFLARTLVGSLVLLDARVGVPALLVYFGSNLAPLFYLRGISDAAFKPVKAEAASAEGIQHVLDKHGITKRERQVVQKICLGKTNKQIADELFISLQTVKDHTHRIYSKLGVKSRMQLVQLMDAAE